MISAGIRDSFLLLGAGASFGARRGLPGSPQAPPLGDDLAQHLLTWLEENDPNRSGLSETGRWRRHLAMENPLDTTAPPRWLWADPALQTLLEALHRIVGTPAGGQPRFEATINQLVAAEDMDTLVLLNRAIAVCMVEPSGPFAEAPDRLDDLVAQLAGSLLGVATLNYDLLLEEALGRAGIPLHYPKIDDGEAAVGSMAVFKLHGSCNWLQTNPVGMSADEEVARRNSGVVRFTHQDQPLVSTETDDVHSVQGHANTFLHLKSSTTRPPILATYGHGKPATHSRDRLDRVRGAALAQVESARRCIVIGVRPPDAADDPACATFLDRMASRPEKLYVSPDRAECDEMASRGFSVRRETLQRLLESGELR